MLYSPHHDQLYKHIIHIHLHMHPELKRRHNNKDERHSSLEKYTSHFIERVVCERELETEQNCNILTPTLMAISVSFPFLWAAQPRASGSVSVGAGFLYHILSLTGQVSKLTAFLSSPSYIIVQCPLLLVGITNCTRSTHPRSRL